MEKDNDKLKEEAKQKSLEIHNLNEKLAKLSKLMSLQNVGQNNQKDLKNNLNQTVKDLFIIYTEYS